MFAKELSVQVDELSEETSVRDNTPVFFHSTNSLHKSQVLLQHHVSQHQGGGVAHLLHGNAPALCLKVRERLHQKYETLLLQNGTESLQGFRL